jgi:hypothetical protein
MRVEWVILRGDIVGWPFTKKKRKEEEKRYVGSMDAFVNGGEKTLVLHYRRRGYMPSDLNQREGADDSSWWVRVLHGEFG